MICNSKMVKHTISDGDDRSLLLDDLWVGLGRLALNLVLLLLLLSLVLLSEKTGEHGSTLAGCRTGLGLVLLGLLLLVGGAAGGRPSAGGRGNDGLIANWDHGRCSSSISLGQLGCSVGALLGRG
jgi:hypothetical protein